MSLTDAAPLTETPLPPLPGRGPWSGEALRPWAGVPFTLPPGDPRLPALHRGEPAPSPPLDNLVGVGRAWEEHPEWLDFLDPGAPNHADKLLERSIYTAWWAPWAPSAGDRVLDLGGGTGRFMAWLMERGCEVELVDPDLRSLWRAVQHAAGRPGRLDVHWSTAERLPDLAPVDAVIAAEVLCYVEDPALALEKIRGALKPGGALMFSVEARWGWAASLDAPPGSLDALLDDGIVHVPADRWVRTFEEADLRALLADWTIELLVPTHYVSSGPFELAAGELELEDALALEARLRAHPVTAGWNRAWLGVAR